MEVSRTIVRMNSLICMLIRAENLRGSPCCRCCCRRHAASSNQEKSQSKKQGDERRDEQEAENASNDHERGSPRTLHDTHACAFRSRSRHLSRALLPHHALHLFLPALLRLRLLGGLLSQGWKRAGKTDEDSG